MQKPEHVLQYNYSVWKYEYECDRTMHKLTLSEREFIDKLYDEQYYQMFVYAQAALADEAAAQEVVQAAFEIACRRAEQLIGSPRPSGWLWNVLKNLLRNLKRNKRLMAGYIARLPDNFDWADIADNRPPDENVDILYEDLIDYQEYKLLKKFALEDRPLKDIAAEAGVSISVCKQRLYRARLKLQKLLKEQNK